MHSNKAQSLLDNKPQNENYLYLKGRVLEKLDKLEDAEKWFKQALDLNPKFSQAAFYLAAIENRRGNFEKSIDLYNYALSKDQIPSSGWKATTPFVSIDIGVACDNTIKANISGGGRRVVSNLKSINSIRLEDIRSNESKMLDLKPQSTTVLKSVHESNPSNGTTTVPCTNKDDDPKPAKPKVKVKTKNKGSLDQACRKTANAGKNSDILYEQLSLDMSAPSNKKMRKLWRIAKNK